MSQPMIANTVATPGAAKIFSPDEPQQAVFREILAELTEPQLVALESGVDFYTRSGVVSDQIMDVIAQAEQRATAA